MRVVNMYLLPEGKQKRLRIGMRSQAVDKIWTLIYQLIVKSQNNYGQNDYLLNYSWLRKLF